MTPICDDEWLQDIFDRTEAVIDDLDVAVACLAAIEMALAKHPGLPLELVGATRRYLQHVRPWIGRSYDGLTTRPTRTHSDASDGQNRGLS